MLPCAVSATMVKRFSRFTRDGRGRDPPDDFEPNISFNLASMPNTPSPCRYSYLHGVSRQAANASSQQWMWQFTLARQSRTCLSFGPSSQQDTSAVTGRDGE